MSRRSKRRQGQQRAQQRADSGAAPAAPRIDGWANFATGSGYSRDKRTWASYLDVSLLDDSQLENLYDGDDLAARIVDGLPEHALRGGYELVYEGESDDVTDLRRDIGQGLRRVEAHRRLTDGFCWGRLFGGGSVLLGADDGSIDLDQPLDDARARELRFLTALERRDLTARTWYDDPREARFGEPETYQLSPASPAATAGSLIATVHESRLILTGGARTTARRKLQNRGWSLSVLQRVHDVIRDFEQSFDSTGSMLLDMSQGVLSQKGLIRSIAQLGASAIEGRMAAIDLYRNNNKMLVLDQDGESFNYISRTLSGLDALLALFMLRMAAAARMPVTVLFGRSPAGLNATGESDLENWYAEVESYREHVVRPPLERIVRILATSLGAPDPESWTVEFPSLWIEGPEQQASRRKLICDRDVAYIAAGVYEPEEVALARAQGWDAEVVIDEDSRRTMLELDRSKAWEEPEPAAPAPPGLTATPALPLPEEAPDDGTTDETE
ncbi:MAG: DUF1073 domain-containing protein [bacterium]